ncbi:MAG TPA: AraC family transcriptional regulator, partial [Gaiellaceae bacterium]|nr:AraC family transcriptional regulator [Gaiellaceae bacterium]
YLLQHVAVRALHHARPDALAVEEVIARAVTRSIAAANAFHRDAPTETARAQRARYALSESAKSWLIENLTERFTLSEIARALHTSPFHLARVFRRETGFSLHDYRNHLRLRTALDRIENGDDLARIAHQLGYSSHSHFTRAFTRAFGVTPSSLRRKSPNRLLDELRTIVAARLARAP